MQVNAVEASLLDRPVVLVGAEFDENLSLRYLAAAVERAGFRAELAPFDGAAVGDVVTRISALDPLVVGISVPFQSTARQALALAPALRAAGVRGHITIGGHFATFEYDAILRDYPAIDSVVRHEGELTLTELCERLRDGVPPAGIPGTLVRSDGRVVDGGKRRLPPLDELPFPDRRGTPRAVLGVRSAPLMGSRGCYGDCSFCCIYAYSDNVDGARYRRRSPESIAEEMRREYRERGVRIFVFNDDNFLVPSRKQNLERCMRLKALLDGAGMDDIALVLKCRPNDVTPELFALLKGMGLIRAYVGIETNSDEGIVSLNRRITPEDNRRALEVLRTLDIYASFNVLIFDPEATLDGVGRNLDFIDEFCDFPSNFCRAEVYAGTPLQRILEREGRLRGDYFAWDYELRDSRVEVLFRIATTAFAGRNFKADGVATLNMGIRFDGEVAHRFFPGSRTADWHDRVVDFSRRVGRDTAAHMRRAHEFVATADIRDHAAVKAFTLDLARRIAGADLDFVRECKALRRELERRLQPYVGAAAPCLAQRREAPWAAETGRLRSSTGSMLSTEILPAPGAPAL